SRCCNAAGMSRDSRSDPTTEWLRTRASLPTRVCSRGIPEQSEPALNALDLVVLVLAVGAGLGGWRLGFAARVLAWAGVVVGRAPVPQLRDRRRDPTVGTETARALRGMGPGDLRRPVPVGARNPPVAAKSRGAPPDEIEPGCRRPCTRGDAEGFRAGLRQHP